MEDKTDKALNGFEFWDKERYFVLKSNKALATIKSVLDAYKLDIKVFNKETGEEVTTDAANQILWFLKKCNQSHGQCYFILNLKKGKLEQDLVKTYWKKRIEKKVEAQMEIAILKKNDPEGDVFCPSCLDNGIINKLRHEGGCVACTCGFSKCL